MAKHYALSAATPESLGIPSSAILNYLKAIDKAGVNLHGFILARHGKIAAEGYYAPYQQDQPHRMYSTSKSFASFAVGLLIDDGLVSLDDPITKFFPDKLPEKLHPYAEMMTVRNLLMMATCYGGTTYNRGNIQYDDPTDWVGTFFRCPPDRYPGQTFLYDTSASTVLGALAERLSGKTVPDFLRSRGFADLGFSDEAFAVKTENGEFSWMGSGFCCSLRDLALFAQVCLNKGEFAGKRIISEDYISAATTKQIDNYLTGRSYGYGYQFWMSRAGFNCSGMGGQMAYCIPGKDIMLVTIADTQGQGFAGAVMEDAFYSCIIDALTEEALPENEKDQKELADFISGLYVKPLENTFVSPVAAAVSGNTYAMNANDSKAAGVLKWKQLKVEFDENGGSITYTDVEGEKKLAFGYNHFEEQNFPGFAPEEETSGKPVIVYGFHSKPALTLPCMTSAAWADERTLNLLCYATGAFLGTLKMALVFDGDKVTVQCVKFAEKFWEDLQGFQSGQL